MLLKIRNRDLAKNREINPYLQESGSKYILKKASSQLHILRVCKFYGYSTQDLNLPCNSLIMPVIYFSIQGCAFKNKYLKKNNGFLRRVYKFGYTSQLQ